MRAVSAQFVKNSFLPSRAHTKGASVSTDGIGQVVRALQVQGNAQTTLPPRRCWSRAKSAAYARRNRDFSFRVTNARVVGLQDSFNFARQIVRSETLASLSHVTSGFVTCPPSCTKPTRFTRHLFDHAVPHCLGCAMDPREKCPHTEKPLEVHQPQESHASNGPSKTSLPPSTHVVAIFAHQTCTFRWSSGNSRNAGPVR